MFAGALHSEERVSVAFTRLSIIAVMFHKVCYTHVKNLTRVTISQRYCWRSKVRL